MGNKKTQKGFIEFMSETRKQREAELAKRQAEKQKPKDKTQPDWETVKDYSDTSTLRPVVKLDPVSGIIRLVIQKGRKRVAFDYEQLFSISALLLDKGEEIFIELAKSKTA